MATLKRADERYLDDQGNFKCTLLEDCDIFCVRSFAAAAGFDDVRYFKLKVLPSSGSPFHCREVTVCDPDGVPLADVFATRTNSAVTGGEMWRARKYEEALTRAVQTPLTDVSSGSATRSR